MAEPCSPGVWDAFSRTTFCAKPIGGEEIRIRIGELAPRLDRILAEHGLGAWAYVTAQNPGAKRLSDSENESRHQALAAKVADLGYAYLEGEGVPDDPGWKPERSLLILGMGEPEAQRLGREFGQLAIVVGEKAQPARLVSCQP